MIGDRLYVEPDGTDLALVVDLLEAGILKHDIVMGLHPLHITNTQSMPCRDHCARVRGYVVHTFPEQSYRS